MANGLLTVTGFLDVAQFWPGGSADADTTTIKIDVAANSFQFRPHPDLPSQQTDVLLDARVSGKYGSAACVKDGKLKVRLQGVDAPELHFRPTLPTKSAAPEITDAQREKFKDFNDDFRQAYGESATVALSARLAAFAAPVLQVRVESHVDEPNDVFDVYARMVGDVVVTEGGAALNLNQWLLENGWVFPTYYSSMSNDEIETLNTLWDRGWQVANRPWSAGFEYKVPAFDRNALYVRRGAIRDDSGPLTMPKIFRRQALWWARKKAGIESISLRAYIAKGTDQAFLTEEFLANGPTASERYPFADFITSNGTLDFDPEFLVFKEDASTLKDSTGHKITAW